MSGIEIRFVGGEKNSEAIKTLIENKISNMNIHILDIRLVKDAEIYEEGILPPAITIFCKPEDLMLEDFPDFIEAIGSVICQMIQSKINCFTGASSGEESITGDFGVFLYFNNITVKYYMMPGEFNVAGVISIIETINAPELIDYAEKNTSNLGNIVLWKELEWKLFAGKSGLISLSCNPKK